MIMNHPIVLGFPWNFSDTKIKFQWKTRVFSIRIGAVLHWWRADHMQRLYGTKCHGKGALGSQDTGGKRADLWGFLMWLTCISRYNQLISEWNITITTVYIYDIWLGTWVMTRYRDGSKQSKPCHNMTGEFFHPLTSYLMVSRVPAFWPITIYSN